MKQDTTELRLTFINVGYGEAILIDAPDAARPDGRFYALIDGGSAADSEFADRTSGRIRAEEYLAPLPRLDLAVSTHIHEDHLVCRDHPPSVLRQTLPPGFYRSLHPLGDASARNLSERNFLAALDDYRKLCALVEQHGGCIEQSLAGDTLTLAPGLTAEVLAPSGTRAAALTASMQELYRTPQGVPEFREKLDALDASMNNFSLILRLAFGKTRILLPGDTNRAGYGGIPPEKLAADLFKVGHHGQLDGADAALVNAVRPRHRATAATTVLTPTPCAC